MVIQRVMSYELDSKRYFSQSERSNVYLLFFGKCHICKRALDSQFHVDHRIPHSKGGRTIIENALALCERCNLEKSNVISFPYAERSWQVRALNQTVDVALAGNHDFVTNACPGAGKTRYAISFIDWALQTNFADLVVYCTPSSELRGAIANDVAEFTKYRLSEVLDGPTFERVLVDGVPNKVHGFSLTYQTLATRAAVIEALCQTNKVLFIGDEIHHAGLSRSWGDATRQAAGSAVFRLGLSGTPFRSDDTQIAFLNYEGDTGIPEYNFFYGEALSLGYVAPVQFTFRNALVSFIDPRAGDEPVTLEIKENHDESEAIKLRAALAIESGYSQALLTQANQTLEKVRNTDRNAAGLVIASSIDHANELARFIRTELGEPCEIVHSQEDTRGRIASFRTGTDSWIISVGMISEGVDIPRLRVLVYLSPITTRLFFHQAIGRVVRLNDKEISHILQPGFIFLPPLGAFVELAEEFENEVFHVLGDDEAEDSGRNPGDGAGRENLDTFTVLEAESWEDGATYSGDFYTQEEIEQIRIEAKKVNNPIFETLPEAIQAELLKAVRQMVAQEDQQTTQNTDEA